jgi:hypothetical protein
MISMPVPAAALQELLHRAPFGDGAGPRPDLPANAVGV